MSTLPTNDFRFVLESKRPLKKFGTGVTDAECTARRLHLKWAAAQ